MSHSRLASSAAFNLRTCRYTKEVSDPAWCFSIGTEVGSKPVRELVKERDFWSTRRNANKIPTQTHISSRIPRSPFVLERVYCHRIVALVLVDRGRIIKAISLVSETQAGLCQLALVTLVGSQYKQKHRSNSTLDTQASSPGPGSFHSFATWKKSRRRIEIDNQFYLEQLNDIETGLYAINLSCYLLATSFFPDYCTQPINSMSTESNDRVSP